MKSKKKIKLNKINQLQYSKKLNNRNKPKKWTNVSVPPKIRQSAPIPRPPPRSLMQTMGAENI